MQHTTPTSPASDEIRDAWDAIAPAFDRLATPFTTTLARDALELVGVGPGTRFLDVAAGSGALCLSAARLGARVLATDISPAMIERLRARADEEGLAHLEARVMDGCALDLDDDTFDVAGSQNGVSLFPDLQAGLGELARVTKPGGRVVIVAFGPFEHAEWLGFFFGAMRAVVPGFTAFPADSPPPPFQVADPSKLRREMVDAGLPEVRVEALTWTMPFRDGAHLYDLATSTNPIADRFVSDLTEEQRAEVRQVLDGMLREHSGGARGGVLECEMNVGIGTKGDGGAR